MKKQLNTQSIVSAIFGGVIVIALISIIGAAEAGQSTASNFKYSTTALGSESFILTNVETGASKVFTVSQTQGIVNRGSLNF